MKRNFKIQIENNPIKCVVTISQNEDGYSGYYLVHNEKYPLKIFRGFKTIKSLFSHIKNDVNQHIGRIVSVQEIFPKPLPERTVSLLAN